MSRLVSVLGGFTVALAYASWGYWFATSGYDPSHWRWWVAAAITAMVGGAGFAIRDAAIEARFR